MVASVQFYGFKPTTTVRLTFQQMSVIDIRLTRQH